MNTTHKLCFLFALVSVCFRAQLSAQEDGEKIPEGEYRKLSSQILSEERLLIVSLPDGYDSSTTRYPVVFMLDGHKQACSRARSVLRELHSAGLAPEMVLIGVVGTRGNRDRDMHPTNVEGRSGSGGADNFITFLERELKPFVAANYRTTDESTIIGFSTSAYFVVYCLLVRSELFDHYIAGSPMLGYGREMILANTIELLRSRRLLSRSLFVIYGEKDPYEHAINTTPDFDRLVRSNKPLGFRYEYVPLEDEGHVPRSTIERGLAWTFSTNTDDE